MGHMFNERDMSYVAGFFDGEGCAAIRMVKSSKDGMRRPRLEARISQNDRTVLDWIRDEFGGNVSARHDSRTPNVNHQLMLTYRAARRFLTALEPYLRVKRDQVSGLLDRAGREL